MDGILFIVQSVACITFAVVFLREISHCMNTTLKLGQMLIHQTTISARRFEYQKAAIAFKNLILKLRGTSSDKYKLITEHGVFIEDFIKILLSPEVAEVQSKLAPKVFLIKFSAADAKIPQEQMLRDYAQSAYDSLMLCVESMCLVGCIRDATMHEDFVHSMGQFCAAYEVYEQPLIAARS